MYMVSVHIFYVYMNSTLMPTYSLASLSRKNGNRNSCMGSVYLSALVVFVLKNITFAMTVLDHTS